jgi:hypothetical protein
MDVDLKDKIHRLWRRFLMIEAPDAEYLEAIQHAHEAGENAQKTLMQFQRELDSVTLRIEEKQ